MNIATTGPVPGSQRLELLDALRGFALAGVLAANLEAFSLYFFLSPGGAAALPTLAADRWLAAAGGLLVSAKFITLFSIMFGIGFALLMQRIGQAGGRRWYLRRLAVLFLVGLLHSAFWWGDILRSYAVAGLLLLPLARMQPRAFGSNCTPRARPHRSRRRRRACRSGGSRREMRGGPARSQAR